MLSRNKYEKLECNRRPGTNIKCFPAVVSIPIVITCGPRKLRGEGTKEVHQTPRQDDNIVVVQPECDDGGCIANT